MTKTIGEAVVAARESAGLTREQLAVKAGIHSNTLAKIEREEHSANMGTLSAIAAALDLELVELIGGLLRGKR